MPVRAAQSSRIAPIVLMLLLGGLLLIYGLDRLSLWVDEGWSAYATNGSDPARVAQITADDVHPPLYFYGLFIWRQITGDSVFAMRYLTVLTVMLTTALIYRFGIVLFGDVGGLGAALVYVLHDLVRVLGQEARQYPLEQCFAVLVLWLYWRFWQQPTRARGIMFILGGAALLWTHYWGGFVLLALAAHTLINIIRPVGTRSSKDEPHALSLQPTNSKLALPMPVQSFTGDSNAPSLSTGRGQQPPAAGVGFNWRLFLPFLAVGLLFIPWLPVMIAQMTDGIPDGIGHALPASRLGYATLFYQLIGTPQLFFGILAAVGVIGTLNTKSLRGLLPSGQTLMLGLVCALTVGSSILINLAYPTLSYRALSVVIPAFVLLIGHTITQFRPAERAVLIAIIVLHSLTTTAAQPPVHLPWPDVAQFLADHTADGERILIETRFDSYALMYYLDGAGEGDAYVPTENERQDNDDFDAYLSTNLADVNGVWVMAFSSDNDIHPQLESLGYTQTAALTWPTELDRPVELWRFDRLSDQTTAAFGDVLSLKHVNTEIHADVLTVNLLWTPLVTLDRDYSISVFLLGSEGLPAAQHDSYPFENRAPTLGWTPDTTYYDGHALSIAALPPGDYALGVKVYFFTDASFTQTEIVPAADCTANCDFVIVGSVTIP